MIKVGLIGFGKTGRIVAGEIIKDEAFTLSWVLRRSEQDEGEYAGQLLGLHSDQGLISSIQKIDLGGFLEQNPVDVIVDFSDYQTINLYHEHLRRHRVALISAISNYPEAELEIIRSLSDERPVLYSPNITLGINFLIVISEVLQKIVPWADVEIIEQHFRDKPDVSGTALKIADILGLDREKNVNSVRVGGIIGKHEVIFGLPNQTIRLIHETNNRAAFGQGIIFGMKYVVEKEKGFFNMEQIIKEKFVNSILN
jgi:4-hydroxy-tetrahydrodipicolinate reductase